MGMTGFKIMDSDGSQDFLLTVQGWIKSYYDYEVFIKIIDEFFDNFAAKDEVIQTMTTIVALHGETLIYRTLIHDPENNKFNFSIPINVLGYIFMQAEVPAQYLEKVFRAMEVATEIEIKKLGKEDEEVIKELQYVLTAIEEYKTDVKFVSGGNLG